MVVSERHVQAIWFDPSLRPSNLFTRTGLSVRVVHPGDWNLGPGPDFIGAVLEIGPERRRLVGDVEVHLSPRDWDAHSHAADPAYGHVVAHVTWRGGVDPPSLPSGAVTIWIGRFVTADTGFSPEGIDLDAYPRRCSRQVEQPCRKKLMSKPDRIGRILSAAGACRLRLKAAALGVRLENGNRHQLFYSEIMRSLGYAHNSDGFQKIAEIVPYAVVTHEPEVVDTAYMVASTFVAWRRAGVRPTNSPEQRLHAAARLFVENEVMELSEVRDASPSACRSMVRTLTKNGCIGHGRAGAIVANVIVPFALACGQIAEVPEWLPAEDVSEKVRRVACRMLGYDHSPLAWYGKNGLRIQGLLHIGCESCARYYPECSGCAVPDDGVEGGGRTGS